MRVSHKIGVQTSIWLLALFVSLLILPVADVITPAAAILGGGSGINSPLPYDLTRVTPMLSFNATYYNTTSSPSGLAALNNETNSNSNRALNLTFNAYDPKTNSSYHDVTYYITITRQKTDDVEAKNNNSTILLSDYFFSRPGPLTFVIQQPAPAEQAIIQKYENQGSRMERATPNGTAFVENGLLIYNVTTSVNAVYDAMAPDTRGLVGPIHMKSPNLLRQGDYHVHVEIMGMGTPQSLFDTPKIPKFDMIWSSDASISLKVPEFPFAYLDMSITFVGIIVLYRFLRPERR